MTRDQTRGLGFSFIAISAALMSIGVSTFMRPDGLRWVGGVLAVLALALAATSVAILIRVGRAGDGA